MLVYLRFLPAALTVLLVLIRVFVPDFLSSPVLPSLAWLSWLSWFWLVFAVVGYLAAYLMTPLVVKVINSVSRRWFLPLAFFIGLGVAALWFGDQVWNHTIHHWFPSTPEANLLGGFTRALFGGN